MGDSWEVGRGQLEIGKQEQRTLDWEQWPIGSRELEFSWPFKRERNFIGDYIMAAIARRQHLKTDGEMTGRIGQPENRRRAKQLDSFNGS